MVRAVTLLFAFAALVIAAGAVEPLRGPCDVKTTEPAWYCPKEERKIPDGNAKDGKCANDGVEVKKIEMCVKKHYVCACSKTCCTDDKAKPGSCKCQQPLQEEVDKCMALWQCKDCGKKAPHKDLVKHDETKCKDITKSTYTKTCEKSGKSPHGN
jgi:hypothetical protein